MSNSSAIVNWDNIACNALHSAQSSMFPGYKETQGPCKKRRFAETAKVRYLPVEEAAKLKSGTRTTTLSTCNSSLNDGEPNGAGDSMAKQGLELGLGMENVTHMSISLGAEFSSAPRTELGHKGDTSYAFVSAVESEVSNGRKRHLDHNSASLPPIKPQLKGKEITLFRVENMSSSLPLTALLRTLVVEANAWPAF
ncbi:unnamed protein product [Dovyalis caffra]|uniref:Uncharacterized protein n=1 Tax=Dovyalis caffra TaxID=77055 RepID=A0AAV1QWV0_9ROSI|nr:unnamed protein product [Dovyalis caffra]